MLVEEVIWRLSIAALLSSAIGLERQLHQKAAGLRTHALVGLGSALIMIVSQHGFDTVISTGRIELDPSRVAAQVVSGIGFLGAGLIFVRQDIVRGLTTAAGIWVCAGIGLACGSGLMVSALAATGLSLIIIQAYAWIEHNWIKTNGIELAVKVTCGDRIEDLDAVKDQLGATKYRLVRIERSRDRATSISYEFRIWSVAPPETIAASLATIPEVSDLKIEKPTGIESGR